MNAVPTHQITPTSVLLHDLRHDPELSAQLDTLLKEDVLKLMELTAYYLSRSIERGEDVPVDIRENALIRLEQNRERLRTALKERELALQEFQITTEAETAKGEQKTQETIAKGQQDLLRELQLIKGQQAIDLQKLTGDQKAALLKLANQQELTVQERDQLFDALMAQFMANVDLQKLQDTLDVEKRGQDIGLEETKIEADAVKAAPDVSTTTAQPGETVIITDKDGRVVDQITIPGTGANGKSGSGRPPTVTQENTAIYANRMSETIPTLEQLEQDEELMRTLTDKVPLPTRPGFDRIQPEGFKSEKLKLYEQAKRDFINAVLRKESGAVISDAEFKNAEKQYFPQPGDTPAVIAQKQRNRRNVFESFKAASGGAFADQRKIRYVSKAAELLENFDAETVKQSLMVHDGFTEAEAEEIIGEAEQRRGAQ